jgi:hypothetical protein
LSASAGAARLRAVIARSAVAAALSLALLHLNLARADAACGSHPAADSAPATVTATVDHHAHHEATVPAPASDDEECDAPQTRDCCAAVASCAIALDVDTRESAVVSDATTGAIAPRLVTAPIRVRNAPEPPPPRV